MPVQCGETVLTGQDGSIWFKPAGTSVCLRTADFNSTTDVISVGNAADFRVGDPVTFSAEGSGVNLPTAITAGNTYYVFNIDDVTNTLQVEATKGAAVAVDLTGSSTPAGTHINMAYAEFMAVCSVSNFDLNLTRNRIDITSLPCTFTSNASKFTSFRTYQPGYADGTGTMTVKFTRDQTSLAQRLLANSLLRVQEGATARLFIDTVVDGTGQIVEASSNYVEVPLSIEGMQFSVTTEDSPTEATLNFSFQGQPTHMFYTSLTE